MIILALDTTTRAGSVAVLSDGYVITELVGEASLTHGQRLPNDLLHALEQASLTIDEVDLLAVTAGPGSFTGLRVGIATMQGLAMARHLRVVPVSTLDALAEAGRGRAEAIAAWMDARRGEVFASLYDADGRTVRHGPMSATPERVLATWGVEDRNERILFIGDGAVRYAEVVKNVLGEGAAVEAPPPLAAVAGLIAAANPSRAVLPHAVVPIYIRKPDAELARDRHAEQR